MKDLGFSQLRLAPSLDWHGVYYRQNQKERILFEAKILPSRNQTGQHTRPVLPCSTGADKARSDNPKGLFGYGLVAGFSG